VAFLKDWSPTQKTVLLTILLSSLISILQESPIAFTATIVPALGALANREYQKRKTNESESP